MPDVFHKNITDPYLHEPKGAATASSGEVYVSDGAGSGVWTPQVSTSGLVRQGIWDYNDLATASTPIALSVINTDYEMTNDGAGPFTNLAYTLPGMPNIWDVATDRFDFDNGGVLNLGDTVDIRFDALITTSSANTRVNFELELGLGGSPYKLPILTQTIKTAGTYQAARWFGVYMGDVNTLNNPARIVASSDTAGVTVQINGWYIRALNTI